MYLKARGEIPGMGGPWELMWQVSHPHALSVGASPHEPSVTLENKKRKVLESGRSSSSEKSRAPRSRRPHPRRPGRSRRPRSRSPEDQLPPLRKSLVTSLRYMSEAIYQSIVHMHKQPGYSPQCWQQLAPGPLTLLQTLLHHCMRCSQVNPLKQGKDIISRPFSTLISQEV